MSLLDAAFLIPIMLSGLAVGLLIVVLSVWLDESPGARGAHRRQRRRAVRRQQVLRKEEARRRRARRCG